MLESFEVFMLPLRSPILSTNCYIPDVDSRHTVKCHYQGVLSVFLPSGTELEVKCRRPSSNLMRLH